MQVVTIMKTQGTKIRGKPTTTGMVDLKPYRQATRLTPLELQTDCFIQTTSCGMVP